MSPPMTLKSQPTELRDPPALDSFAVLRIARRARVTIAHAAVVVQLAGLGAQPREAR